MASRINFLPDERFSHLRPALRERLQKMADAITPENFSSLLDARTDGLFRDAFQNVGADEGSLWLLDPLRKELVITYNSGNQATVSTGFRQAVGTGLISMSLASEQGFVENEAYRHEMHSGVLDSRLQKTTYAMIVVPFYFLGTCRGVVTCVQLVEPGWLAPAQDQGDWKRPGFSTDHLDRLKRTTLLLTELIDFRLLRLTIGWESL